MRIGIDGSILLGNRAGGGRYVYELCRALDRQLPQATFFVYSYAPVDLPVLSRRWIARVDPVRWANRLKWVPWLKMRAGALCSVDQLDVFWATGTLLPKLPSTVNIVSTVYDLNYLIMPNTMSTGMYCAFRMFFERDIRHANRILTISVGTAKRLQNMLGIRAEGIVLPAVSPEFRRPLPEVISATLTKLGVVRPYILAIGTLEPRKNLELLIEVFAHLKLMGQITQHRLVLVGDKGWKNRKLKQLLKKHADAGIVTLGYIEEADLPSLYAGTDAFVFPSKYEGFGMPVLEARACGSRIVATDLPEIREAGGVGPMYIPPTAAALTSALHILLLKAPAETYSALLLSSWDESARVLARALTF
jgi:glycosyltransferase involved in cell wall biosynthesis